MSKPMSKQSLLSGQPEPQERDSEPGARGETSSTSNLASRRGFLKSSTAGLVVGALAGGAAVPSTLAAQNAPAPADSGASGRRILLQGGIVLSMDPQVGDFERGDVLIEGKKILAVGPGLSASGAARGAAMIDATDRIVLPGFIDTHFHHYQTVLRGIISDGLLAADYNRLITNPNGLTLYFQPEDAYAGVLLASVSQIRAGVTAAIDLSQVQNSPAHTDACIAAFRESGRRAVFAYSRGFGPGSRYPQDVTRLRSQYFSSDDQLLTLALNGGLERSNWALARQTGVPIIDHVTNPTAVGNLEAFGRAGLMRSDNTYIHCISFTPTTWQMVRDTGGRISISPIIEMAMGHGTPVFQEALDRGIRPSLSSDVEPVLAADMFTMMRSAFSLQRMFINERASRGERNLPARLTCRDVIEFATIQGARAAQLDHKVGSLTPGKEADILLLRADDLNVLPLNDAPGAVVNFMDTSNVDTVLIAGKVMKWKGNIVGVDQRRLRRLAERARDGILARARHSRNLFETCCPHGTG